MDFNIKLNIGAIVKAEQFLKKPFQLFDYSDEHELKVLLYCCVLVNSHESFTYRTFCDIIKNSKQSASITGNFDKACRVAAQFNPETDTGTAQTDTIKPTYIGDIVAALIVECGVDANYIMSATINDITPLITAFNNKKREDLEGRRLWTFLTVAPHIDVKKIKTVQDFHPFPWEQEAIKAAALENIEKHEKELEEFLSQGMNYITGKQ